MASKKEQRELSAIIGQLVAAGKAVTREQLYRQLVDAAANMVLLSAEVLRQVESSGNALQPG